MTKQSPGNAALSPTSRSDVPIASDTSSRVVCVSTRVSMYVRSRRPYGAFSVAGFALRSCSRSLFFFSGTLEPTVGQQELQLQQGRKLSFRH